MSSVHRTAEAVRNRERTVDEVLRATVFSPENFPRLLTVSIWVSTAKFYGVLGWKYYSRQVVTAASTTTKTTTTPNAGGGNSLTTASASAGGSCAARSSTYKSVNPPKWSNFVHH